MAIFHMSAQMLTRSKGHSATKAAAYRHAAKITDEKTGEVHDFTRKKGVYASMMLTPENTPDHLKESPEALWGAVERSENRSNSQVAREFNIALPHELSDDQKVALAEEFCREHLVKHGMIADVAFHDFDSENPHFHVMTTTRKVDPNSPTGFSKNKPREWNDKAFLEGLREDWANTANDHLQKAGIDARIDHRSLADQRAELDAIENPTREQQAQAIAIDRDPTIHRGRSGNPERQERFETLYQAKLTKEEEARLFGLTESTPAAEHQKPKPSPDKSAPTAGAAPESADKGGIEKTADFVFKDVGQFTPMTEEELLSAELKKMKKTYDEEEAAYTFEDKRKPPQAPKNKPSKGGAAADNKQTITDDFHDTKGMSKSQIEELEALDEVHAAQRKAAAETEKATAGFSSANIQQSVQQEPEPSA
ncbi:MobQ family relaxase, partial [Enterobacter hormaechei]|uniref:MobQ family relaxase n=1 Tax=Enterobacter hormaechei TaxID=158836 RepID=UPI002236743B